MIIRYGNIYSVPQFESAEERVQFEKALTVHEMNTFTGSFYEQKFYGKDYRFLSGLIPYLKRRLSCNIVVEGFSNDTRNLPVVVPNSEIKLRPYQEVVVKKSIYEKRGINNLVTGAGKTLIATAIMTTLGLDTLFIVHTLDLAEQTRREWIRFGVNESEIGVISGNEKSFDKKYTIALIQSLLIALKSKDPELEQFFNRIRVLFIDESHHTPAYSYMSIIKKCNAEYRYGLSGSVFIDMDNVTADCLRLMGATGGIINEINYEFLRDLGYLCESKVFVYNLPKHVIHVDSSDYVQSYKVSIVNNEIRNRYICEITNHCYKQNHKTVIVVKHIQHGEILLKQLYQSHRILGQFYMGSQLVKQYDADTDSIITLHQKFNNIPIEKFRYLDRFVLLLSPAFFEGIDIPNISAIIRADAGRSKKIDYQIIGRGLRLKPDGGELIVIDFTDNFNYIYKNQSKKRISNYQSLGLSITYI